MGTRNNALVAHLFRRAAFGLRSADHAQYPLSDYAAAVEALVQPTMRRRDDHGAVFVDATSDGAPVNHSSLADAQAAWVRSMALTRAPLLERMTLFLSNHFATAPTSNVDTTALVHQQATIRRHALGNFAELTHAMLDDLALACFLNNDRNRIDRPNENFGRELMELFLLGPGNYTEHDVKEVSRALTGYSLFDPPEARPTLVFKQSDHDPGPKTVLGVTARFTPHGVVDHLLAQPAAKRFLATKLVTTFVSPHADPPLVGLVASKLQGWDLAEALRTLLLSQHFRKESAHHTLPKTPAEYLVGMLRGLDRVEYDVAHSHMQAAGQSLFRPPSVAGWPTGKRMLGAGAMVARYNAAAHFASLHVRRPAPGTPKGANLDVWMTELGLSSLSPATRDAIDGYLRDAGRQTTAARTAGVLTLLLSSIDFQLA